MGNRLDKYIKQGKTDEEYISYLTDERDKEFMKMLLGLAPFEEHSYARLALYYKTTKNRIERICKDIICKIKVACGCESNYIMPQSSKKETGKAGEVSLLLSGISGNKNNINQSQVYNKSKKLIGWKNFAKNRMKDENLTEDEVLNFVNSFKEPYKTATKHYYGLENYEGKDIDYNKLKEIYGIDQSVLSRYISKVLTKSIGGYNFKTEIRSEPTHYAVTTMYIEDFDNDTERQSIRKIIEENGERILLVLSTEQRIIIQKFLGLGGYEECNMQEIAKEYKNINFRYQNIKISLGEYSNKKEGYNETLFNKRKKIEAPLNEIIGITCEELDKILSGLNSIVNNTEYVGEEFIRDFYGYGRKRLGKEALIAKYNFKNEKELSDCEYNLFRDILSGLKANASYTK